MGDETWSYLCEDDMEARGVALLLDRQGLTFEKVQHSNGSVTFQCRGESGRKAAALEAEMLRHHAEQERDPSSLHIVFAQIAPRLVTHGFTPRIRSW